MTIDIESLTNEAAIKAVSLVARRWFEERGLEAYVCLEQTRRRLGQPFDEKLDWGKDENVPADVKGGLSRHLLVVLNGSADNEVRNWTREALEQVQRSVAHVLDPATMLIGGGILIGAILAARVKSIDFKGERIDFYKDIPEDLKDVIKAGSSIIVPVES